jgi:ABC-type antimicrobial peptide transport system permease subunit
MKGVAIADLTTLSAQVDASIVPERLIASLSGFFGGVGALLAGVGIYGLLAYSVTRRRNEIGIRIALGATTGGIVRMVLMESLGIAVIGALLAVPLLLWARPIALNLIRDVTGSFSLAVGVAMTLLLAAAILAGLLPARRAALVNPVDSLRHD